MSSVLEQFRTACEANDGAEITRVLRAHPDQFPSLRHWMDDCAYMRTMVLKDCDESISVIARAFPGTREQSDGSSKTPFLLAVQKFKTKAMLALARAGTDIHALDDPENPESNGAVMIATTHLIHCTQNHDEKLAHLLALRSLGLHLDEPQHNGETPLRSNLITFTWPGISPLLCAGANLYKGLHLPQPEDPFKPDIQQIIRTFRLLRFPEPASEQQNIWGEEYLETLKIVRQTPLDEPVDGAETELRAYIESALQAAPQLDKKLTFSQFIADGAMRPDVLRWESLGLLPLYFSRDSGPRWEGGTAEMLKTVARFPDYLQNDLNLFPLLRDAPTPREDSVTARYTRAQPALAQGV